jgi:holo-[acyl-carrier protein] synthase
MCAGCVMFPGSHEPGADARVRKERCGVSSDAKVSPSARPGAEYHVPEFRVGTDLCAIEDVARALEHFGERYLRRVYSEHEIAECTSRSAVAEALAGRFAAKEAVLKALRPRDSWAHWRDIEVRRDPAGWCDVVLSGKAAELAEQTNVVALTLSISHEREYAQATAIATIAYRNEAAK